eukprot:TRINITY_DN1489_c1_g1_i4.p3 TRINITY_DN1489_c1_g1~~TRINITY_DN1489_c1_g1_i4.p3  ORF type:complete len:185 (-),score=58.05 TRINITY_DN1489_c1_g1_i4:248-802(-)
MNKIIFFIVAAFLAIGVLGMAEEMEAEEVDGEMEMEMDEGPATFGSIVDAAVATPELSSLVAAVTAAGLVDTLADPALVATVFAPTNDAFAAALSALGITFEALANDTATLTDILLYHVVPAKALSTDLMDGMILSTLGDSNLTVSLTDGVVIEAVGSSASVVTPDVVAGAGVVHIINEVLLPF